MKTKTFKLRTILFIVLANLLFSSPIFAQVKTSTNKTRVNQINKKEIPNTRTEGVSAKKEITNKEFLTITKEGEIPTPPYSVGDFIHGGIVFYVDTTGKHGLVCAKMNQTSGQWSRGVLINVGADKEGLYGGMENTIAAVERESGNPTAPRVCYELEITEGNITYSDWYLPSKDELNLMSQNQAVINTASIANGGEAFGGMYWSSTENQSYAWLQICSEANHESYIHEKVKIRSVRAIRRF